MHSKTIRNAAEITVPFWFDLTVREQNSIIVSVVRVMLRFIGFKDLKKTLIVVKPAAHKGSVHRIALNLRNSCLSSYEIAAALKWSIVNTMKCKRNQFKLWGNPDEEAFKLYLRSKYRKTDVPILDSMVEIVSTPKELSSIASYVFSEVEKYIGYEAYKVRFVANSNNYEMHDMQYDMMVKGLQTLYLTCGWINRLHLVNTVKRGIACFRSNMQYSNATEAKRRLRTTDDGKSYENMVITMHRENSVDIRPECEKPAQGAIEEHLVDLSQFRKRCVMNGFVNKRRVIDALTGIDKNFIRFVNNTTNISAASVEDMDIEKDQLVQLVSAYVGINEYAVSLFFTELRGAIASQH